jgi:hypothetical protein
LTTATDEAGFLSAIIADPDDDTARLVYADWLQEQEVVFTPCDHCDGEGRLPAFTAGGRSTAPSFTTTRTAMSQMIICRQCPRCSGAGRKRTDTFRERAEFIRVQIRSARDAHIPVVEAHAILRRERELFRAHCDRWFPVPPGHGLNWGIARPGELLLDGRPHYEVSRGFVESVTCTAADWLRHSDAIVARHPITAVRLTEIESWAAQFDGYNGDGTFRCSRWPHVRFTWPTTDVATGPIEETT